MVQQRLTLIQPQRAIREPGACRIDNAKPDQDQAKNRNPDRQSLAAPAGQPVRPRSFRDLRLDREQVGRRALDSGDRGGKGGIADGWVADSPVIRRGAEADRPLSVICRSRNEKSVRYVSSGRMRVTVASDLQHIAGPVRFLRQDISSRASPAAIALRSASTCAMVGCSSAMAASVCLQRKRLQSQRHQQRDNGQAGANPCQSREQHVPAAPVRGRIYRQQP